MGKIRLNDIEIEVMDDFSHKDFTGRCLTDENIPPGVIYQSCFSQELPDSTVFPSNMFGVTFVNCNLDNAKIPDDCHVVGGSRRRFKLQNDLREWELDQAGRPVSVFNAVYWKSLGFSVDPKDIPKERIDSLDKIKKASDGVFARLWRKVNGN